MFDLFFFQSPELMLTTGVARVCASVCRPVALLLKHASVMAKCKVKKAKQKVKKAQKKVRKVQGKQKHGQRSRSGPSGWERWREKQSPKKSSARSVAVQTEADTASVEVQTVATKPSARTVGTQIVTRVVTASKQTQAGGPRKEALVQTVGGVYPYPFPSTWRSEDHLWAPPRGLVSNLRRTRRSHFVDHALFAAR